MSRRARLGSFASKVWKGAKFGLDIVGDFSDSFPTPVKGVINAAQRIISMAEAIGVNRNDCQTLKRYAEQVKTVVMDACRSSESSGSEDSSIPAELAIAIDNLVRALEAIVERLKVLNTSINPKGLQHIKAFFNTAEVASVIQECTVSLKNEIEAFQLGLNLGNTTRLADLGKRQAKMEDSVVSTSEDAKLQTLRPAGDAGYRSGRPGAPQSCMEGTRTGLLREIWAVLRVTTVGSSGIVWIKGKAGTGKSTVSQTICQQAASEGSLGASFFCSRAGEAALSDPRFILRTIAAQLARFDQDFKRGVIDAVMNDPDLPFATFHVQIADLIMTPLRMMKPESKPLVLIALDGLDECEKTSTKDFLAVLVQAAHQLPSQVKILITSRPEFHIRSVLDPPPCISPHPFDPAATPKAQSTSTHPIHIYDIESAVDVETDIRTYLKAKLDLVAVHPEVRFSLSPAHLDMLAKRSGSLFIIAATYARFIGDEELSDPAGRLTTIINLPTSSGVPSTPELDALYSTVLNTATPAWFASPIEEAVYFTRLRKVLGMIVFLRDQLPIVDMERLAGPGIKSGDFRLALRHLHSVISVPATDSEGFPRVHHPSFADFLCEEARCKHRHVLLDVEEQHASLAIRCFDSLEKSLTRRFPHHVDPEVPNTEVRDLREKLNSTVARVAQYACRSWAWHLSLAATGHPRIIIALDGFLRCRLIWWMEVMSLLGDMNGALEGVIQARKWMIASPDAPASNLMNDAYRLLLTHLATISQSAPQLYRSVLPFVPVSTELARTYGHLADGRVRILEGQGAGWPPYLLALRGGGRSSRVAAFSPDGKLVASASPKGVRVWDGATGAVVAELHDDRIVGEAISVSFSEDSSRITSVNGGAVGLWDLVTGSLIAAVTDEHRRPEARIYDYFCPPPAILSSNGQRLVTAARGSGPAEKTRLFDWVTGQLITELRGDVAGVISKPQFSPDTTRLAFVQNGVKACLWNGTTGQFINECGGHPDPVTYISFSPDSQRLITVSYDESAKGVQDDRYTGQLWDTSSCVLISMLDTRTGEPVFSPDSKWIALTQSRWNTYESSQAVPTFLWDGTTGSPAGAVEGTIPRPNDWYSFSPFSPNAKRLITEADRHIHLWETASGDLITSLKVRYAQGYSSRKFLGFSPDSQILAASLADGTSSLWDGSTGQFISTLPAMGSRLTFMFLPDLGHRILQASRQVIRLWGMGGTYDCPMAELRNSPNSELPSFSFAPSGKVFISSTRTPSYTESCLWNVETGAHSALRGPTDQSYLRSCFTFSRDSLKFMSSHGSRHGGTICLWETTAGPSHSDKWGHQGKVQRSEISPDGRRLATGSIDQTVRLFSTATGAFFAKIRHSTSVNCIAFSPDSSRIASGSQSGEILLSDTETGELIAELEGHRGSIFNLVFSQDGRLLATACDENAMTVWDSTTGSLISATSRTLDWAVRISFSPDSERLLSIEAKGGVSLWETQTCTRISALAQGFFNPALAVSPDSKLLAVSDSPASIQVRSCRTDLLLSSLDPVDDGAFGGRVHDLAFSPNSQHLASVSADYTLRLWSVVDGACIYRWSDFHNCPRSVWYTADGERIICLEERGRAHRFLADHMERLARPSSTPPFNDHDIRPMFDYQSGDHSLYKVPSTGERIFCCTLPWSIQFQDWTMTWFKNTVVFGCYDGRVVIIRVQ